MPTPIVCPRCRAESLVVEDVPAADLRCRECGERLAAEIAPPPPPAPRRHASMTKVLLVMVVVSLPALALVAAAVAFAMKALSRADVARPTAPAQTQRQDVTPQEPGGDNAAGPAEPEAPLPPDPVPPGLLPMGAVTLDNPPPASPAAAEPPPASGGSGQLPADVLQRVKNATVHLRVTLADGTPAQGSGFFAVEPGLVFTNAHVLGLQTAESRPPRNIEVVVHSGETNERKLSGRLLGADHGADLAVLRVAGADLPAPLTVISAASLRETQPVFVAGFPFGDALGKNLTVSPASVSSLRKRAGVLHRLQMHGGMNPGNSGGPVVDEHGRVVGVAVAIILNTQINFAVPGDAVHALLHGRVTEIALAQPYRSDREVKVPVVVGVLDPLGRLRGVALDRWLGGPPAQPGAPRPPATSPPAAQPGDGPRETMRLPLVKGMAQAELVLPAADGKAYWFQPAYTDAADTTHWASALAYQPPPPVERRPATLAHRPRPGSRPLDLLSRLVQRAHDRGGAEHAQTVQVSARIAETRRSADADGTAEVRLQYERLQIGIFQDNEQQPTNARLRRLASQFDRVAAELRLDRQGSIQESRTDAGELPAAARGAAVDMAEQLQRSLEAVTVPLPGGQVEPGGAWRARRRLALGGGQESVELDMNYIYQGTRQRDGRTEAVVLMEGNLRPRPGTPGGGRASGAAVVDLEAGQVSLQWTRIDFELQSPRAGPGGQPGQAGGTLEVQLRRGIE